MHAVHSIIVRRNVLFAKVDKSQSKFCCWGLAGANCQTNQWNCNWTACAIWL